MEISTETALKLRTYRILSGNMALGIDRWIKNFNRKP